MAAIPSFDSHENAQRSVREAIRGFPRPFGTYIDTDGLMIDYVDKNERDVRVMAPFDDMSREHLQAFHAMLTGDNRNAFTPIRIGQYYRWVDGDLELWYENSDARVLRIDPEYDKYHRILLTIGVSPKGKIYPSKIWKELREKRWSGAGGSKERD